jgi:adenylate cyclase
MSELTQSRRLATILAIDIAGFSRASERDEVAAAKHVRDLRDHCSASAAAHRGRIFNTAGDGVMLEFPTVADGVAAALDIADGIRAVPGMPAVRMGLHLGDATVLENGDLIGTGVNVAARVQQRAEPGQILTTGDVRNLFATQSAAAFTFHGNAQLEKMNRQVELFALARPGVRVRRSLWNRYMSIHPWIRNGGLALLGIASGVAYNYATREPAPPAVAAAPAAPQSSVPVIAVLPFENLSADPGLQFFSDGITEEIQTALSRIPGLRVISRASSFAVGEQGKDVRAAAAALNASHVLTGTVRRNGSALRVAAQLLGGRTGEILWSETFERPVSETLAVQDEIASRVARALRIVVPETARAKPIDPKAFELYLRGREAWQSGSESGKPPQAAIADLEEAVRLAPDFARAWAALASAYAQRQNWVSGPEQDALIAKAIAAANRALALDPAIGEAYIVLGRFDPSPDWAVRGAAFAKAIAASPNDDEVQMLYAMFWLMETGQMDEARRVLARAYETDPLSELVTSNYAMALSATGDGAAIEKLIADRRGAWPDIDSFWTMIVPLRLLARDFAGARDALARAQAYFETVTSKYPEKNLQHYVRMLTDTIAALETGDKILSEKVAATLRAEFTKGQAAAQGAVLALALLGLTDEAMAAGEELYVRRGFQAKAQLDFPIPSRFPYGRPTVGALLGIDADILRRDTRLWSIFAAVGLARYWLDSGQWPDFCTKDPDIDCRAEAEKAIAALKMN